MWNLGHFTGISFQIFEKFLVKTPRYDELLREFSYDIKFMLKNDVEVNELDAIDMGELSNECALGRCDFTSTQILSALR